MMLIKLDATYDQLDAKTKEQRGIEIQILNLNNTIELMEHAIVLQQKKNYMTGNQ